MTASLASSTPDSPGSTPMRLSTEYWEAVMPTTSRICGLHHRTKRLVCLSQQVADIFPRPRKSSPIAGTVGLWESSRRRSSGYWNDTYRTVTYRRRGYLLSGDQVYRGGEVELPGGGHPKRGMASQRLGETVCTTCQALVPYSVGRP